MSPIYLDLETRSRLDVRDVGVHRYVEDDEFAILLCSYSDGIEPVTTAVGHDAILDIPGIWDEELIAHNAQFDRVCLAQLDPMLGIPEQWNDTAALCAEYGWPVGLDNAAIAMKLPRKDSAGTKLINLFSKPNRQGGWNDHITHPLEWIDFMAYCEQDVEIMMAIHGRLGRWPTDLERATWVVDQYVNDAGMPIDVELCQVAAEMAVVNAELMTQEFRELTGVDNPRSVPQMMRWVKEQGLDLPNMQAETLQRALDNSFLLTDVQERALTIRTELALAAASKFSSALECVNRDGRVRGGFKFFGAHTGRWAGQRVQPQNLPRASLKDDAEVEEAITKLKVGLGASPVVLKSLVRSMFTGPMTVVDYAAIEARVVAWLASEQWALDAFADGRDIYVETAQRMGGMTRFQGKVAVLALGYNGGINSLKALGAEGDDKTLRKMVDVWRRANLNIVELWGTMQDCIDNGGRVGKHLYLHRRGDRMSMLLPSGRFIHYHHLRWEKHRFEDEATGRMKTKESWRYDDPKAPGKRIGTYGGRLVENATQAIARDLLAEGMVRVHNAGLRIIGHVHDELIVEGNHLEQVTELMTEVPKWAAGLPLDAEGFVAERYRK